MRAISRVRRTVSMEPAVRRAGLGLMCAPAPCAFARWDTLSGAVFEASPLVRQKDSFAAGFAIAWIFGRSQRLVEAED